MSPPPLPVTLDALPADEHPAPVEAVLEALPARDETPVRREKNPVVLALWALGRGLEWLFGAAVLMVGLAALAALPVLQFLSLGYLLEAGGRVARSGRLRDGFIGVRIAARLGGIVMACWLFLLPVRMLSDMAHSAQIIDPGGKWDNGLRVGLYIAMVLVFLHISLACARGGKLRYFRWPFNFVWFIGRLFRGGYYASARDAVWNFTLSLRLPHYFWLGLRGFAAAFAWLFLPVSLL